MKWLYRILRLFFCPHRWEYRGAMESRTEKNSDGHIVRDINLRILECRYCGIEKTNELRKLPRRLPDRPSGVCHGHDQVLDGSAPQE